MKRITPVVPVLPVLMALAAGCGGKAADPAPDLGAPAGEITVSAYDTNGYRAFLEDAAKKFQARYPGAVVNVETFSAMPEIRSAGEGRITQVQIRDDPQSAADYVTRVYTALMSGGGADLYAMDVLPLHKFVEGGQLENLEAYMDGDPGFNRDDYRGNILDALDYRGGVWFMPTGYTFKYFAYDSTLVPESAAAGFGTGTAWTTGELLAIGEAYYDGGAKLFNLVDYSGLAGQLLNENMRAYVDFENKTAGFSGGGFAGLLESVRRAGETGYVPHEAGGPDDAILPQAGGEAADRFFFKLKNSVLLVAQFGRELGLRMMAWTGGEARGREDDDEIAGIAADAAGRVPFGYSRAFGISSGSKNKALAWAFVKFLLGEEMQLGGGVAGDLPLHNKAREMKAETAFSGAFRGRPPAAGMEAAVAAYRAATEQLSDQIDCFQIRDNAVSGMISAETRYFFDGTKTAEEAAAALQNKVDLYLNE
ncbi:MAG: extracellular solute-binding protein [Treponema sp.]|jgi:multiple sugar transport system substrate-binding protein|nr:extracellular solute-binding protein [Treponema sp.]